MVGWERGGLSISGGGEGGPRSKTAHLEDSVSQAACGGAWLLDSDGEVVDCLLILSGKKGGVNHAVRTRGKGLPGSKRSEGSHPPPNPRREERRQHKPQ